MADLRLSLRPYQEEGVDFLVKAKRAALWDEMGLGKTAQALIAMRKLTSGWILVVTPRIGFGSYVRDASHFLGERPSLYMGNPLEREGIWKRLRSHQSDGGVGPIVVVNYHILKEIPTRKAFWNGIIYDEAHHLSNRHTQWYKVALLLQTPYMFQLTGSPIVNSPADMWGQLHVLNPNILGGYHRFVNRFLTSTFNGYHDVVTGINAPQALRDVIKPHVLRRLKKDHLSELPDKTRERISVSMGKEQKRLYDQVAKEMIAEWGTQEDPRFLITPNVITKILRLRQILISPELIGAKGSSGAIDTLVEWIDGEFQSRRPVVVFTPFANAIPIIANRIRAAAGGSTTIYAMHGKLPDKSKIEIPNQFQSDPNYRRVLISTIRSATSWDAYAASDCFFVGSDWVPARNEQAEDRLHRLGQYTPVRALYLIAGGTIDEYVLRVLNKKMSWTQLTINATDFLYPSADGEE